MPPKREVEHVIQLFLESPLPTIVLYRQFVLKEYGVTKLLRQLLEQGVI